MGRGPTIFAWPGAIPAKLSAAHVYLGLAVPGRLKTGLAQPVVSLP